MVTMTDIEPDFNVKVRQLINELNEFRQDPEFHKIELSAREASFIKVHSPSEF